MAEECVAGSRAHLDVIVGEDDDDLTDFDYDFDELEDDVFEPSKPAAVREIEGNIIPCSSPLYSTPNALLWKVLLSSSLQIRQVL